MDGGLDQYGDRFLKIFKQNLRILAMRVRGYAQRIHERYLALLCNQALPGYA